MTLAATMLKATGVLGVTAVFLAVLTLWLVFTEPVAVSRVAQSGDFSALFEVFTHALVGVLRTAAKYL
jgi:hypothetical protein